MTCKDCVHYDVCNIFGYEVLGNFDICVHFKDKSKFIELPCKVGDKVFVIDKKEIYECSIYGIDIDFKGGWFTFLHNGVFPSFKNKKVYYLSEMGKTVFLTKEEAEQALRSQQ